MELEAIAQLVTVLVAAMAIVWHQQRGNDTLREELNASTRQIREEFNASNRQLSEAVAENGQRLARIEGYLGIGMPTVSDTSVEAGPK